MFESKYGNIVQRSMYFNNYLYLHWVVCNGFFLYLKPDIVRIPYLLIVTVYILMVITFAIKLKIAQRRHFTFDIQKLTWFCLLTLLVQLPLLFALW